MDDHRRSADSGTSTDAVPVSQTPTGMIHSSAIRIDCREYQPLNSTKQGTLYCEPSSIYLSQASISLLWSRNDNLRRVQLGNSLVAELQVRFDKLRRSESEPLGQANILKFI